MSVDYKGTAYEAIETNLGNQKMVSDLFGSIDYELGDYILIHQGDPSVALKPFPIVVPKNEIENGLVH